MSDALTSAHAKLAAHSALDPQLAERLRAAPLETVGALGSLAPEERQALLSIGAEAIRELAGSMALGLRRGPTLPVLDGLSLSTARHRFAVTAVAPSTRPYLRDLPPQIPAVSNIQMAYDPVSRFWLVAGCASGHNTSTSGATSTDNGTICDEDSGNDSDSCPDAFE